MSSKQLSKHASDLHIFSFNLQNTVEAKQTCWKSRYSKKLISLC